MIKIAIVNCDCEYRKRLSYALEKIKESGYEFHIYSSVGSICEDGGFIPDIIFSDEAPTSPEREDIRLIQDIPFVLLSDNAVRSERVFAVLPHFAGIPQILETADRAIPDNLTFNTNGTGAVTVFTSPFGGVGTSVTASAFSRALAAKGKKVLYVNMHPFDIHALVQNNGNNLSMPLFGIKTIHTTEDAADRIMRSSYPDTYGVYRIFGYADPRDSIGINEGDISMLIDGFRKAGFDHTVIDYPFGITEKDIEAINKSDRTVFVTTVENTVVLGKILELLKTLLKSKSPKFLTVINRINDINLSGDMETLRIPKFEGVSFDGVVNEICRMELMNRWT